MRPGGKVVIETVNPQSLYVFARSFYLDPTHVRPVHPAYLEFLFREAGFAEVEIDWRNPPPDTDQLLELVGDDESTRELNENFAQPRLVGVRAAGLRHHRDPLMEIHQVVVSAVPGDAITGGARVPTPAPTGRKVGDLRRAPRPLDGREVHSLRDTRTRAGARTC